MKVIGEEFEEGYLEYLDNVVYTKTWSRLDYAYDSQPTGYCGGGCLGHCDESANDWFSWLREQELYPPPALAKPLLASF